ncbi:MAG: tetratricopeptide repeat protein [Bdellovibrionales bacterium]
MKALLSLILLFSFYSQAFIDFSNLDYLEQTKLYQQALAGDVSSMHQLGLIYYYGDGKNYSYSSEDGRDIPIRDLKKAFIWFQKAAEQGNLDSIYHLALLHFRNPNGDFKLGEFGINQKEGFRLLIMAAEQNHVLAQVKLADLLLVKDEKTSLYWQEQAAKNGHIPSQYHMAIHKFHHPNNVQDQKEAIDWFLDFVQNNQGKFAYYSMSHIARAYFRGLGGLEQDPIKAYAWHSLSLKYENNCSSKNQDLLEDYRLSPQDIQKALQLAKEIEQNIGKLLPNC